MVNAWNVGELDQMVLPPCHYGFQVYTREMTLEERLEWNHQNSDPLNRSLDYFPEHLDSMNVPKRKISLMWNQRSVDTFLGLPFNIASYGLILEIIAKEVNMVPDELIGNLGDTHLYLNHITQAKEQIKREPYSLPKLKISRTLFEFGKPDPNKLDLDYYSIHNFELLNYQSHPAIKAPLSN
jgi:thymidylate synthase